MTTWELRRASAVRPMPIWAGQKVVSEAGDEDLEVQKVVSEAGDEDLEVQKVVSEAGDADLGRAEGRQRSG